MRIAEQARAGVNVRVWRHDLRRRAGGVRLPADWRGLLLARGHQLGHVHLVDVGHNLVTDAGLNLNRDRVRGVSAIDPLTHLAVGTGSTAATAADTTLEAEVFRDVFTQVLLSAATITIRYYLGPNNANGETLTEAGLFNDDTTGSLYARRILGVPIVKTIDVAATIEWTLTWSAV